MPPCAAHNNICIRGKKLITRALERIKLHLKKRRQKVTDVPLKEKTMGEFNYISDRPIKWREADRPVFFLRILRNTYC